MIEAPDRDTFVARYGSLFEHSPWVAERAYEHGPFEDREALLAALTTAMHEAPRDMQVELVRAHPELAVAADLTPGSRREQSSRGLDRLTGEQHEAFTRANAAYRERFGFPFVICVRDHDRDAILAAAEARLQQDPDTELRTALEEIARIARHRLDDLP